MMTFPSDERERQRMEEMSRPPLPRSAASSATRQPATSASTRSSSGRSNLRTDSSPSYPSPPPPLPGADYSSLDTDNNKYDAVYYTKEPIAGRGEPDFDPKDMDVDIDMERYRSTMRPSDL